jgi:hypothetical protein
MDTLGKIFGGRVHMKIMRLFLLNPDKTYDAKMVITVCRGNKREVEWELRMCESIGLIKRKPYYREGKKSRVRERGWTLDTSFIYLTQLRSLLVDSVLFKSTDLVKRLSRGGNLKFVVLAGIFIQNWDSRVDILIAGDKLKKGVLERMMHAMENEIGRELHYSILDTTDFQYRMSIGDKLVRDILDYPHQTILNKLGIEA